MIRMPHSTPHPAAPTRAPEADGPLVVKVGGGLLAFPGALDHVCEVLGRISTGRSTVIVPGGGPFADAVREFERRFGLTADAGHWMALLGMDQYAHVLGERIPGAELVEDAGGIGAALRRGRLAVLAPYRWLRSADVLPHSWEATGDSVAAFVAGALDASRLILVKPADDLVEPVDRAFAAVVPAGLPVSIVGWQRLETALPPA
jgi:5-(aminomethyl)-3-furanmethanol phosphate kinase